MGDPVQRNRITCRIYRKRFCIAIGLCMEYTPLAALCGKRGVVSILTEEDEIWRKNSNS